MGDRTKAFIRGWNQDFLSLEEALTHADAERFLIDLQAPDTVYSLMSEAPNGAEKEKHTVSFTRPNARTGEPVVHTVYVNPAFHDYMERYGDRTRYITDAGTPWLTRDQELGEIDPEQARAYYDALSTGPNQDVIMVNWRKTNAAKKDTGHSAISIGTLNRAKGVAADDPNQVFEYQPDITGSFYPVTGPLFRPMLPVLAPIAKYIPPLGRQVERGMKNNRHHLEAARERLGDNSVAHSMGVAARDAVKPLSVAAASTVSVVVAKHMVDLAKAEAKGEAGKEERGRVLNGLATLMVAYTAAKTTGILDAQTGVVLLKEEDRGSGILATLVTPAQMDIMQHALYGMYKTYHDKYNILGSNCADFADKMMEEVGLETSRILDEALGNQQENTEEKDGRFSRFAKAISVPPHIRPSRVSWAFRNRKPISGEVEIDEQPLSVGLVKVNNQSTVLIETEDHLFKNPPIETFQRVLKEALTLKENRHGQFQFDLQPGIKRIDPSRAAAAAR